MGGETNQWAPLLYHGMNRVELPNEMTYFNAVQETAADILKRYDELGGRRERRHPRTGRTVRRVEPVPERRQADLHVQLPRPPAGRGRGGASGPRGQSDHPTRVRV
jgi:hypothetical protein